MQQLPVISLNLVHLPQSTSTVRPYLRSTCLKQSASNCYGCTLGTRTFGTGTCLSLCLMASFTAMSARGSVRTWRRSHQAASQQQDSALSRTRGTAYSRIKGIVLLIYYIAGTIPLVESQNSLRNRGLHTCRVRGIRIAARINLKFSIASVLSRHR